MPRGQPLPEVIPEVQSYIRLEEDDGYFQIVGTFEGRDKVFGDPNVWLERGEAENLLKMLHTAFAMGFVAGGIAAIEDEA